MPLLVPVTVSFKCTLEAVGPYGSPYASATFPGGCQGTKNLKPPKIPPGRGQARAVSRGGFLHFLKDLHRLQACSCPQSAFSQPQLPAHAGASFMRPGDDNVSSIGISNCVSGMPDSKVL